MKTSIKNLFLLPALIAGLGLILAGRVTAQTFTTLRNLDESDGVVPYAGLILSGNTLYGTTYNGGGIIYGVGTVFAVNTNGTGFTNLYNFTGGSDGSEPRAGLILSGNTLYGTTCGPYSGAPDGTVFAVKTDGTGFTNLHSFTQVDGSLPYAGVILSSNTLYGTTYAGGFENDGTVFAVNTNGTGFTNLYNFTGGSDGSEPQAGLILSGNTLYGTTYADFENNGTVFAINIDGSGFTNLHTFYGVSGGSFPQAGLILSGNTLYGTTGGDTSQPGTVFAVNTNGTGFTNLYSFTRGAFDAKNRYTNSDGAFPYAGLILSGNTLYGTASGGGTNAGGTVFSLTLESVSGLLQITTTSLPSGTVGVAYNQTVAASGGRTPYSWTNISGALPPGLTLATNVLSDAVISGNPTTNGPFNFTVKVTDAASNTATQVLSLTINIPFTYATNNGTITITGYTGPGGAVTIPNTINGLTVTSIGTNAFYNCSSLTSVTIGTNVTTIGDWSFTDCFNLTNATIPNSVTSIGEEAFGGCWSLTSVTIPNSVTNIGADAFEGIGAISVTIGTNVTSIGAEAFAGSGLEAVVIPKSVTNIGVGVFYLCENLGSVTFANGLTSIGTNMFYECYSLNNVTIPASVTRIGDYAFYNCESLNSVTIGSGVTSIGQYAFSGENPPFPEYAGDPLTSVIIPNTVTNIGTGAFDSCSDLRSVTIGNGVMVIGQWAFLECLSLTSVNIPDSVTTIGEGAFIDCYGLTYITIGKGVTSIGANAFTGSYVNTGLGDPLISITIPNSVTNIGGAAFYECYSLSSVTIGNGVTSIGDEAFEYCTKLTNVCFAGNASTNFSGSSFYGDTFLSVIFYLSGATGWGSTFDGIPTAPCSECGGVAALQVTTTSLPGGMVGVGYNQPLAASGGQTPYSWTNSLGALPPGLTLATNGVISGTPTVAGTSNFTVRVTDAASYTATQALSLTINVYVSLPIFQSATLTDGQFMLTWSTVINGVYQLQYKTNMTQTNWINIGSTITASSTALSVIDAIGSDKQRFYRVQKQ